MDPASIIALSSAALQLVESAIPTIQSLVTSGQITTDQQATLLASYNSLKAKADGQFAGPEWQVS